MTCDAAAGLYERTDGGEGCYLLTQVGLADQWQTVGLFLAVVVVVTLSALVVAQWRR